MTTLFACTIKVSHFQNDSIETFETTVAVSLTGSDLEHAKTQAEVMGISLEKAVSLYWGSPKISKDFEGLDVRKLCHVEAFQK